jgi:regulatory protein
MAQTWHSGRREQRPKRRPLDESSLEERAIAYVGRYATTRARLADYLRRKLTERGWAGAEPPPVERLVERLATLGYVDDESFATARAAALRRRGYGARRVDASLRAAGIDDSLRAATAADSDDDEKLRSAAMLARRKRLGPFASQPVDRDDFRRAMGAMLRAGHDPDVARRVLTMAIDDAEKIL